MRQVSRAPQYAHLNARATRRGTRFATSHARAHRAHRQPVHRLRTARPEHRRQPLRPRSGRIRSPIR
ncbi:histidine kinase [Burkholderia sp. Bp8998]|nr:histidine kinase [Burkholderia sp. Bp8998]